MSMKVLHVIGSLGCGGAQVALRHLVENINTQEIELFIYPLRSSHILMPIRGTVIKRSYRNYDPRKFLTILKLCKKYDIDILTAHLTKPIIACLLATFFCKCKLIVHEHGAVLRKGLEYFLYRFVLRLLWHRAAVFIAVSRSTADSLVRRIGIASDRIKVIPNAVEFDVFDPERISSKSFREELAISDDDIVLGFVGRLNYAKGVDLLIKATALLLQCSQRYFLLIAGDGPEQKTLQKLSQELGIADRVRFIGFCENIPEIMSAFDVGIIPSRCEPFGIVCLEFMRMKVPIVTSGVSGIKEIVTDKVTGLMTGANTPEEIARCIERLVTDKTLRERLMESAYKRTQHFGVNKYVEAFQRVYEELLC